MNNYKKINKQELIKGIENLQLKKDVPNFGPGDTIAVYNIIKEETKSRVQKFEGVVLRRRGRGLSESFNIRKESNGIWVEEILQLHSPLIEKIEIIKRGKVRRAYISYMRERSGKSARIKEKK
ncbi:MAG: 50S ribosomal protein L19 [Mycoplasmoidaceae bacterium]